MIKMKEVLIIFTFFIEHSFSAVNLENTLNNCCDIGKKWSLEKRSCNITLSFPLLDVASEHSTMCLTIVGACCVNSFRELRCNEGKQVGLENGICQEKTQIGKNQVDFIMCCEVCKIGVTVGSTKTTCQPTSLFSNNQWNEVYQSCCSLATTKVETISTEIETKYNTDESQCNYGTNNCKSNEKCVSTPNGIECYPRPLSLRMPMSPIFKPEIFNKYKKKIICDTGYAYDVLEQRCTDIDECSQGPCEVNEICENTPGSFKCSCETGFKLDQITNACIDVNECQLNLHTCQVTQRCDNTVGSYQCVRFTGCGTGYTLDVESALCIDDDECMLKTDTCSALGPDWICRNTQGSFRCERKRCTQPNCKVHGGLNSTVVSQNAVKCLRGYEIDSNNKCKDINECKSPNRCLQNELCINTNGSFYCLPRSKNYSK